MSAMGIVPPVPTLAQMEASCLHNADVAMQKVTALRNTIRNLPPGPDLSAARHQLSRELSDFEHWSESRLHYKARAAKEGPNVVPYTGFGAPARAPQRPIPRDPRLPREPGDDDE